jgi:hypothetical protein
MTGDRDILNLGCHRNPLLTELIQLWQSSRAARAILCARHRAA